MLSLLGKMLLAGFAGDLVEAVISPNVCKVCGMPDTTPSEDFCVCDKSDEQPRCAGSVPKDK